MANLVRIGHHGYDLDRVVRWDDDSNGNLVILFDYGQVVRMRTDADPGLSLLVQLKAIAKDVKQASGTPAPKPSQPTP